jgi:(p)ppGpp synthase/HD superfamily hydrolase
LSTLENAIAIAAQAHADQKDKAGAPYIFHPLRVMLSLESVEEQIVAVLHDIVEDSPWTLERLGDEGFSIDVINAIDALTRRTSESYSQFIERAAINIIARRVKLADLRDNSDISRFESPTDNDYKRVKKYQKAIKYIENIK